MNQLSPPKPLPSLVAAVYGRYSDSQQKATSIDDQLRRCAAVAERIGAVVPAALVFTDEAVSGTKTHGRTGYAELMRAWDDKKFDVLILDTQSRLFRDEVEAALTKRRITQSGVRVVCASGLDTQSASWELLWSFQSSVDADYSRQISFNVKRGMEGALLRGATVSAPPFGYRLVRFFDGAGERTHSNWAPEPAHVELVKEIFARRLQGQSFMQIARFLNSSEVGKARKNPFTVQGVSYILRNPVYAGILRFGKHTGRADLRAQRTPTDHLRPDLALVDTDTWSRCQRETSAVSTTNRGGYKHWSTGLVTHHCGHSMCTAGDKGLLALRCGYCFNRARVEGPDKSDGVTFSQKYLVGALEHALETLLTPAAIEAFRARLAERLLGGTAKELAALDAEVQRIDRSISNLLDVLSTLSDMESARKTKERVALLSAQKAQLLARRPMLERGLEVATRKAAELQLTADPLVLLRRLWDSKDPSKLRSILRRLFPVIEFEGRPGVAGAPRGNRGAILRICVAPGAAPAILTGTTDLDTEAVCLRVVVEKPHVKAPMRISSTPVPIHSSDV